MTRLKVYLDTSVLSAYFDARAPDRMTLTRQFWLERLPELRACISSRVLEELAATPDQARSSELLRLAEPFELLEIREEAVFLAQEYVSRGIFRPTDAADSLHLAIAVTNGIGYLLSWNFRHLVRLSTRRQVNLVNSLVGYESIEILAPPEL